MTIAAIPGLNKGVSASLPFRPLAPVASVTPEIAFSIIDVTPALAKEWLARNFDRNRGLKRRRIERYKRMIADGKWRLTHQGIGFNHEHVLIDGQNRLTAISESPPGTVARVVVATYAVDTRALDAIDLGSTRTAGDVLALDGIADKDSSKRSAAITASLRMGLERSTVSPDHQQIADTFLAFKREICWAQEHIAGRKLIAPVSAAFAYAHPVEPEKIASIAERVISGVGLEAGSAELTLHRFIADGLHAKNNGAIVRGPTSHRLEVFYKVLNALRCALRSEPMGKLQAPRSTSTDGLPTSLLYFANRRKATGLHVGL